MGVTDTIIDASISIGLLLLGFTLFEVFYHHLRSYYHLENSFRKSIGGSILVSGIVLIPLYILSITSFILATGFSVVYIGFGSWHILRRVEQAHASNRNLYEDVFGIDPRDGFFRFILQDVGLFLFISVYFSFLIAYSDLVSSTVAILVVVAAVVMSLIIYVLYVIESTSQ